MENHHHKSFRLALIFLVLLIASLSACSEGNIKTGTTDITDVENSPLITQVTEDKNDPNTMSPTLMVDGKQIGRASCRERV